MGEWEKIFPSGVMTFLTDKCDRFTPPFGEAGEYYPFPRPGTAATHRRRPHEPELSVPYFRGAVVEA